MNKEDIRNFLESFAPKRERTIVIVDFGNVEKWKEKDPITNFEKKLLKDSVVTEKELKDMKDRIEDELDEAVNFANGSPYPDVETLKGWVVR